MAVCIKCGEFGEAEGGIGCTCNACPGCVRGAEGKPCFMHAGCRNCGRAMMMHTSGQLDVCLKALGSNLRSPKRQGE